jgi:Protein of unknown function (DUF3224)
VNPKFVGILIVATATVAAGHIFPLASGHSANALAVSLLPKDVSMTQHATGPFEVKLTPLEPANKTEDNVLGRMSIDKQFRGDLEAVSKGEMLTAGTITKGSAGYVAIERVSGSLKGRSGTFILQHNATMTRGTPQLNIIVVPDSGTGELTGLTGTMNIIIAEGGKHSYDFTYSLPDSK